MPSYKYTRGMSLSELQNMDPERLMNLPEPALREAVGRLAGAANKRLVRAEETEQYSPAIRAAQRGGSFSTAGKDITALRNEFIRARNFLADRTTTKTGYEDYKDEVRAALEDAGWTVSSDDLDAMLNLFDQLTAADGEVLTRGARYKRLREMGEIVAELDANKSEKEATGQAILNDLSSILMNMGESEHGQFDNNGGVSRFFELS